MRLRPALQRDNLTRHCTVLYTIQTNTGIPPRLWHLVVLDSCMNNLDCNFNHLLILSNNRSAGRSALSIDSRFTCTSILTNSSSGSSRGHVIRFTARLCSPPTSDNVSSHLSSWPGESVCPDTHAADHKTRPTWSLVLTQASYWPGYIKVNTLFHVLLFLFVSSNKRNPVT